MFLWKSNPFNQFMYKQIYKELFDPDRDKFSLSVMIIYFIRLLVRLLFANYFDLFNQKEYFFFEHINECFFNNDPIFLLLALILIFQGIFICMFYKLDDTFYSRQIWHSLFDIIASSIENGDDTQKRLLCPERTHYFDHIPRNAWSRILFIEKFFEQLSLGSYVFYSKYPSPTSYSFFKL